MRPSCAGEGHLDAAATTAGLHVRAWGARRRELVKVVSACVVWESRRMWTGAGAGGWMVRRRMRWVSREAVGGTLSVGPHERFPHFCIIRLILNRRTVLTSLQGKKREI